MPRPARVSPDRILAAAAAEFSERGYAGARVDRIARRARVNKAMLYYHFASKQGLYRTLLRQTFGAIAAQLQAIAATDALDSPRKLDAAVATLAAAAARMRSGETRAGRGIETNRLVNYGRLYTKPMKIVIAGGTGFLGRPLCAALQRWPASRRRDGCRHRPLPGA